MACLMSNRIRLPPCHSVDLTNQSALGRISPERPGRRAHFECSVDRDGGADQAAGPIPGSPFRASLSLLHAWGRSLAAMTSL